MRCRSWITRGIRRIVCIRGGKHRAHASKYGDRWTGRTFLVKAFCRICVGLNRHHVTTGDCLAGNPPS